MPGAAAQGSLAAPAQALLTRLLCCHAAAGKAAAGLSWQPEQAAPQARNPSGRLPLRTSPLLAWSLPCDRPFGCQAKKATSHLGGGGGGGSPTHRRGPGALRVALFPSPNRRDGGFVWDTFGQQAKSLDLVEERLAAHTHTEARKRTQL